MGFSSETVFPPLRSARAANCRRRLQAPLHSQAAGTRLRLARKAPSSRAVRTGGRLVIRSARRCIRRAVQARACGRVRGTRWRWCDQPPDHEHKRYGGHRPQARDPAAASARTEGPGRMNVDRAGELRSPPFRDLERVRGRKTCRAAAFSRQRRLRRRVSVRLRGRTLRAQPGEPARPPDLAFLAHVSTEQRAVGDHVDDAGNPL